MRTRSSVLFSRSIGGQEMRYGPKGLGWIVAAFCTIWVGALAAAEPYLVKDIQPGPGGSWPLALTASGDKVFFLADDGARGGQPSHSPGQLWVSDGTEEGTRLVMEFRGCPEGLAGLDGRVFLQADDGVHGRELWVSDGSEEGARLVKDIRPGPEGSRPSEFRLVGDRLLFTADDGLHGRQLWVSDGTAEETRRLSNFRRGTEGGGGPWALHAAGDRLFFYGRDGMDGIELRETWTSDGTPEGTVPFREIVGPPGRQAGLVTAVGDRLFFRAGGEDGAHGLWVSDGTPEGTRRLSNFRPGGSPWQWWRGPSQLTAVGGRLFFTADDGEDGIQLWVTDGTPEGTRRLSDFRPALEWEEWEYEIFRRPLRLIAAGERLFFTADDGVHGTELWVSNGAPEGTRLVADILPDTPPYFFFPFGLIAAGERVLFAAAEEAALRPYPVTLWGSDGTPAGTRRLASLGGWCVPDPDGARQCNSLRMLFHQGRLFFPRHDDIHGLELWALELEEDARFRRGDCNGDGALDISDAVCILEWLFRGGAPAGCAAASNANGDGAVDISDPIWILGHLFLGGPPPAEPFPDCGPGKLAADGAIGCRTPPPGCR
jgi:ELWxxDGT repeat protein